MFFGCPAAHLCFADDCRVIIHLSDWESSSDEADEGNGERSQDAVGQDTNASQDTDIANAGGKQPHYFVHRMHSHPG